LREANSQSPSEDIPRLSVNPKFLYHIYKIPSLVSILSQINPIH